MLRGGWASGLLLEVHSINEFCRCRGGSTGEPKNIVFDMAGCDMRRSLLLNEYDVLLWWVEKSNVGAKEGTPLYEATAVGEGAEEPDMLMSPPKGELALKFNMSPFIKSLWCERRVGEDMFRLGLDVGMPAVVGIV